MASKPARQKIVRPAALSSTGFVAAQPAPPRDRSWERANPTASYRIPAGLRDEITALAQENLVTASDLAAFLLAHAMADVKAGRIKLAPRLKKGKYTL